MFRFFSNSGSNDVQGLFHRLEDGAVLTPHVGGVGASGSRGNSRQGLELRGLCIEPGLVLQAGAEPEGSGGELGFENGRHLADLRRGRGPLEVVSEHLFAQSPVAGEGRQVNRRGIRFSLREELFERERGSAVLADHRGGDALAHGRERFGVLVEAEAEVGVGVDEARSEREARGKVVGLARAFLASDAVASARTGEVLASALSAAVRSVLLYRSLVESIEEVAEARKQAQRSR